jgi:hypothetical protein
LKDFPRTGRARAEKEEAIGASIPGRRDGTGDTCFAKA